MSPQTQSAAHPADPASPAPAWRPGAAMVVLRRRARMLARLRAFFADREVLEVETPALSAAGATDPHLESVALALSGRRRYLHTSPEFPMKRLLAAGTGDIYQVCRVFRGGEQGRCHNPEFTMLEWYRVGMPLAALMAEVEALVGTLLETPGGLPAAMHLGYREAVHAATGLDAFAAGKTEIAGVLAARGVEVPRAVTGDRDALLDLVLALLVEPSLDPKVPVFIHEFPASQAALARVREGDPPVAERFELFLGGMELANGFHELADPREQRRRFDADRAVRGAAGCPPVDARLLAALAAGLPDCCGVALGFDRLVMLAAGLEDIGEAMAFDHDRA